ncbi:hypothetical protein [Pandoraea commovens]|uniref:Uncharacterized protein n=1 Tax=Pandoraea commovens TaxID=2508289 RepID=A0A5E4TX50_9BURK|nr:hypothetical protein [Pandoraea commovens]UVA79667.1 hypothetical protein NTU39_01070 [Pandoraea commovens]VVD91842.1 hypothetical protein PCO31010_01685 [Pandoraea commovens]
MVEIVSVTNYGDHLVIIFKINGRPDEHTTTIQKIREGRPPIHMQLIDAVRSLLDEVK